MSDGLSTGEPLPGMSVTYVLERRDMMAFYSYNRWRNPVRRRQWMVALFVFLTLSIYHATQEPQHKWLVFLVDFFIYAAVTLIFTAIIDRLVQWRSLSKDHRPGLFCEHTLTLTPLWLEETTSVNKSRHDWTTIHRVAETPKHIFIFVGVNAAHIIPRRAFAGEAECEAFFKKAAELMLAAKSSETL